jgi:MoaA/NifB/PqqE/SkfB family radical SAM enzyme
MPKTSIKDIIKKALHIIGLLFIARRAKELLFPPKLKSVRLLVGTLCNHKCVMCDSPEVVSAVDTRMPLLEINEYLALIEALPQSVKNVVVISAGEALLYPNIELIFRKIKQRSIRGELVTNGSLLTSQISQMLVDIKWDSIRISLHAASRDVFYKVHGVDHFDQVIKNIKGVLAYRKVEKLPELGLHFVIQKDNFTEICDFVDLANDLIVDTVSFNMLYGNDPSQKLMLNAQERDKAISFLKLAKNKARIRHNIGAATNLLRSEMYSESSEYRYAYLKDKWCLVVQDQLEILPMGTVMPCCFASHQPIPGFNVRERSLREIWKGYRYFRDDLRKGKFYPFCYKECRFLMPTR